MTDSLRDLIAETIYRRYNGQTWTDLDLADALLADPTLAAIIDLAARYEAHYAAKWKASPELRALLRAWREQAPSHISEPSHEGSVADWRAER